MWKQEIKARRYQVHNQVYIKLLEEQEKAMYPMGAGGQGYDQYYYEDGKMEEDDG